MPRLIKLVKHSTIDTEKWDNCVRLDTGRMFYGLSWYLDILVKEWDALVLNDYEAVFPLISNKKLLVNYLFRPYGVQQLGVFSKVGHSPELMRDFIAAIPGKYKFVDVFLNVSNPIGLLNSKQVKPNTNFELNLNRS